MNHRQEEWYQWNGSDLRLCVFVQPKASKNEIVGIVGSSLKLRVTAPPADNQANTNVIKLLAKTFKVSKSKIKITSGQTSRHKTVLISSPQCIIEGMKPADTSN